VGPGSGSRRGLWLTVLVPPAVLAIVVGVGVAGGHPDAAATSSAPASAVAVAGNSAVPVRVVGGDGLMGRLPFAIPGGSPLQLAERVDRFTIDDRRLSRPILPPSHLPAEGGAYRIRIPL
jgi:hypothetical protein